MNNWRHRTPLPRIPPPDSRPDAESRRLRAALLRVRRMVEAEHVGGSLVLNRRERAKLLETIDEALDTRGRNGSY